MNVAVDRSASLDWLILGRGNQNADPFKVDEAIADLAIRATIKNAQASESATLLSVPQWLNPKFLYWYNGFL